MNIIKKREINKRSAKKYRENNKAKIALKAKEYYFKNKNKIRNYAQNYRNKTKSYRKIRDKEFYIKTLGSWEGLISKESFCEICGIKIYFNNGNRKLAIHFDHRDENVPIKEMPSQWLLSHKRTLENERLWTSCNFGMLCGKCNRNIPTKNRRNYVAKLNKYVFGREGL